MSPSGGSVSDSSALRVDGRQEFCVALRAEHADGQVLHPLDDCPRSGRDDLGLLQELPLHGFVEVEEFLHSRGQIHAEPLRAGQLNVDRHGRRATAGYQVVARQQFGILHDPLHDFVVRRGLDEVLAVPAVGPALTERADGRLPVLEAEVMSLLAAVFAFPLEAVADVLDGGDVPRDAEPRVHQRTVVVLWNAVEE
jgi:hypothetical protein